MASNSITTYMKRLGKSVAFAAADLAKDYTPHMNNLYSNNKDYVKELYNSVSSTGNQKFKLLDRVENNGIYKQLSNGWKNLKTSVKTGEFYNEDRKQAAELESSLNMLNSLLDIDMDQIEDQMNGVEEPSDDTPIKGVPQITKGDQVVADTISYNLRASTNAIAKVVTQTSELNAGTLRTTSNLQLKALKEQANYLVGGFNNVTNGLSALSEFNERVVGVHVNNSRLFYENMTRYTQENNAILKEMLDMKRATFRATMQSNSMDELKSSDIENLFDREKGFNLRKYISLVQTKAKQTPIGGMFDFIKLIPAMMSEAMANPLHFVTKKLLDSLIDNSLKRAVTSLDKNINGYIENALVKLGNYAKDNPNSIFSQIARAFGINNKRIGFNTVDTSKYNKGAMQWNGIAQKALVEVIPGHLRRIEAALTGDPERVYDFQGGKWTISKTLKLIEKGIDRKQLGEAFRPIKEELGANVHFANANQRRQFSRAFEEFQSAVADRGMLDFNHIKNNKYKYGSNEKLLNLIIYALQSGLVDPSSIVQLTSRLREANDAKKAMSNQAESGNQSLINELLNGSYNHTYAAGRKNVGVMTNGLTSVDKFGNSFLDYQNSIDSTLKDIRNILSTGNGNAPHNNGTVPQQSISNNNDQSYNGKSKENGYTPSLPSEKVKYVVQLAHYKSNLMQARKARKYGITDDTKTVTIDLDKLNNDEKYQELVIEALAEQSMDQSKRRENLNSKSSGFFDQINSLTSQVAGKNLDSKGFLNSMLEATSIADKFKVVTDSLQSLTSAPQTILTSVLTSADKMMYDFLFDQETGEKDQNGKPIKGFFQKINSEFTKVAENFNNRFNEWMKDNLSDGAKGLKKAIGDISKEYFGIDPNKIRRKVSSYKNKAKESIISAGKDIFGIVKDSVTGTASDIAGAFTSGNGQIEEPETRARGITKNTKYGLAVVGPGEAIIPANLNPWNPHRDTADLRSQAINENSIKEKFKRKLQNAVENNAIENMQSYAEGTSSVPENGNKENNKPSFLKSAVRYLLGLDQDKKYTKKEIKNQELLKNLVSDIISKSVKSYRKYGNIDSSLKANTSIQAKNLANKIDINDPEIQKALIEVLQTKEFRTNKGSDRRREILQNALSEAGFKGNFDTKDQSNDRIRSAKTGLMNGTLQFIDRATGMNPRKGMELANDAVKKNLPELTRGGIGGALLGTILPVGGPIIGAMAGSAISIIKKNKSFQEYMFGKEITDKDGKTTRDNSGLISNNTVKTIQKYLPDAKKYGITGALAGLILPFGPLGGMMIGAGASILKNNKTAQDFLFGEKGGLINKDRKEKIKRALPNIGMATLGTLFMGPFGIMGNAVLGAGLGLLSTTESFKRIMLGAKDKNGVRRGGLADIIRRQVTDPFKKSMKDYSKKIAKWFKDDVMNPLAKGLSPLGRMAMGVTKDLLTSGFNKLFKNASENTFGRKILGASEKVLTAARKAGGLVPLAGNLAGTVISKPIKLFSKLSRSTAGKYALKHGYYSDKTAEERMQLAKENGLNPDDYALGQFDQVISNVSNGENAKERLTSIQAAIDAYQDYKGTGNRISKNIQKERDNLYSTSTANVDNYLNDHLSEKNPHDLRNNYMELSAMIEDFGKSGNFEAEMSKFRKALNKANLPRDLKEKLMDQAKESGATIAKYRSSKNILNGSKDGNLQLMKEIHNALGLKGDINDVKNQKILQDILNNKYSSNAIRSQIESLNEKEEEKAVANTSSEADIKKAMSPEEKLKMEKSDQSLEKQDQMISALNQIVALLKGDNDLDKNLDPKTSLERARKAKTGNFVETNNTRKAIEDAKIDATINANDKRYHDNINIDDRSTWDKLNDNKITSLLIHAVSIGKLPKEVLKYLNTKNLEADNQETRAQYADYDNIMNELSDEDQVLRTLNQENKIYNSNSLHKRAARNLKKAAKMSGRVIKRKADFAENALETADRALTLENALKLVRSAANSDMARKINGTYNGYDDQKNRAKENVEMAFAGIPYYGNFAGGTSSIGSFASKALNFAKEAKNKFFGGSDDKKDEDKTSIDKAKSEPKKYTNDDFTSDELRTASNSISESVQEDKTKAQGASPDFNKGDNIQYSSDSDGDSIAFTKGEDGTPIKLKTKANAIIEQKHKHERELKERSTNALEAIAKKVGAGGKDVVEKTAAKPFKGLFGGLLDSIGNLLNMLTLGLPVVTMLIKKLKALPGKILGSIKKLFPKAIEKIAGVASKAGGLKGILKKLMEKKGKGFKAAAIATAAAALYKLIGDDDEETSSEGSDSEDQDTGKPQDDKDQDTGKPQDDKDQDTGKPQDDKDKDQNSSGGLLDAVKSIGGSVIGGAIGKKFGMTNVGSAIGMSAGEGDMSVSNIAENFAFNKGMDLLGKGLGKFGKKVFGLKTAEAAAKPAIESAVSSGEKSVFSTGMEKAKDAYKSFTDMNVTDKIKNIGGGAKEATSEAAQMAVGKVKNALQSVVKAVGKWIPGEKAAKAVNSLCDAIMKKVTSPEGLKSITKKLAQQAGAAAAGAATLGIGTLVVEAGFAISNFIHGMNSAEEMLKLPAGTATTGIKIVSGLTCAICGAIPIIGAFIPEDWVLEQAIKIVGPAVGFGEDDLNKLRQSGDKKAQQDIKEAQAGTTEGSDFVSTIKKASSGVVSSVIEKASSFASNVADKAKAIADAAGTAAGKAVDWVKNTAAGVGNWVADRAKAGYKFLSDKASNAWNTAKEIGSSAADWVKQKASGVADWVSDKAGAVKDLFSSGKGKHSNSKSIYGKGKDNQYGTGGTFYSQLDPEYAMNMNVAGDTENQTMADSGCGPVSASNAISALGEGDNPKDAAEYALKNGYKEKDGGIRPQFFKDYMSKKGIDAENLHGAKDIVNNLQNGNPVVLMGQDDRGETDKNPFAENPHYVTATDIDQDGNITIQDPESRTPNKVYKASDVISKSSVAIGAHLNGMGKHGNYGRSRFSNMVHRVSKYARGKIFSRFGKGDPVVTHEKMWALANWVQSKTNVDAKLIYGQWWHEAGADFNGNPELAAVYNFGGLTQKEPNGFKQPDGSGYYKTFDSPENWAEYFAWYLNQEDKPPLGGMTDPQQYAEGLKSNGYFGASVQEYTNGIIDGMKNIPSGAPDMSLVDESKFKGINVGSSKSNPNAKNTTSANNTQMAGNPKKDYYQAVSDTAKITVSKLVQGAKSLFGKGKHTRKNNFGTGYRKLSSRLSSGRGTTYKFINNSKPSRSIFGKSRKLSRYGRGNGETIWNYLKDKGFSSTVIAGIMGNLQAESGLDPTIIEGGGHADEISVNGSSGYGLCQWTDRGRQQGLADFATSKGTSSGDLTTQLDYMIQEMEGYPDLVSQMDASGDPYKAALIFHRVFERSADSDEQAARRGEYANEIFKTEGKGQAFNGTNSGKSGGNQGSAPKRGGILGALDELGSKLSGLTNVFGQGKKSKFGRGKSISRFGKGNSSDNGANNNSSNPNNNKKTQAKPSSKPSSGGLLQKFFGGASSLLDKFKSKLDPMKKAFKGAFDKVGNAFFGKYKDLIGDWKFGFSSIFGGDNNSKKGNPNGSFQSTSSDAGIQAASAWAQSMVGQTGYGNNGCTEFVKNYLLHANNQVGSYMQDCSPIADQVAKASANNGDSPNETLMWVPTLSEWAREQNIWKDASQGGAEGDICVCNRNGHVVIADGKGGYWGNSSSKNQIVHSDSISATFDIQGYVATGSGASTVSNDQLQSTAEQRQGEAGSSNAEGKHSRYGRGRDIERSKGSKVKGLASRPNMLKKRFGRGTFRSTIEEDVSNTKNNKDMIRFPEEVRNKDTNFGISDSLIKTSRFGKGKYGRGFFSKIKDWVDKGRSIYKKGKNIYDQIKEYKKKHSKHEPKQPEIVENNIPATTDNTTSIAQAQNISSNISDTNKLKAPNGKVYSQNDIKYILDHPEYFNGATTIEDAVKILSTTDKYTSPVNGSNKKESESIELNGVKYSLNDIDYILKNPDKFNGAKTVDDAIKILAKDSKYKSKIDYNNSLMTYSYDSNGDLVFGKKINQNTSIKEAQNISSNSKVIKPISDAGLSSKSSTTNTNSINSITTNDSLNSTNKEKEEKDKLIADLHNRLKKIPSLRKMEDFKQLISDIPSSSYSDYNALKDDDNINVCRLKTATIIKQYIQQLQSNTTTVNNNNAAIKNSITKAQEESKFNLGAEGSHGKGPNGKAYTNNDILYILKNPDKFNGAKTVEDAIKILEKDPKYATENKSSKKESGSIELNGVKYSQNDIDYILKNPDKFNGAKTVDDAIKILKKDPKYANSATNDQTTINNNQNTHSANDSVSSTTSSSGSADKLDQMIAAQNKTNELLSAIVTIATKFASGDITTTSNNTTTSTNLEKDKQQQSNKSIAESNMQSKLAYMFSNLNGIDTNFINPDISKSIDVIKRMDYMAAR